MNAKNVLKYASDQGAKFVSVRFTDLPGAWHHLTFPISELSEGSFEDGFGFDASSLRGWAAINESDMLLIPDASRFWIDPFMGYTGDGSNGVYHIRRKEGYVPLPPLDTLVDIRGEISEELSRVGINVECHHHEVATGGQCEIDFR